MGFHKGKMIPIPNGHRKLGIPIPMPNLVIMARATFLQEGACSQLASGLPKIWTYNNLYLPRVAVGMGIPMGIPMEIPMGIHMGKSDPHSHPISHTHGNPAVITFASKILRMNAKRLIIY